jgi:predicted ATP-grasp superfamily ATP-dependent carboligase
MMAEAAADEGFSVIAMDVFGDADTRRASLRWERIGPPGGLHIDPASVLVSLEALAAQGCVLGWVAGGGFEGLPDLLEQGAAVLPLLGTAPAAVRRVRDPATFFGFLERRGIAHPEVRWSHPAEEGWLLKDPRGSGGWHIHRTTQSAHPVLPAHHYAQREMAGLPMSATFVANGREAHVLGFNELIVRKIAGRPCVYCGVVGPVPLPAGVAAGIGGALQALVAEFSLRGLGSLDFMCDGERWGVLEVNPRPSASLFLYAGHTDPGLMHAHVGACLDGELPSPVPKPTLPSPVSGNEIVFARRPLVLGAATIDRLAARPHVHDVAASPTAFGVGEPVCSVGASGDDARDVRQRLEAARLDLLHELESPT